MSMKLATAARRMADDNTKVDEIATTLNVTKNQVYSCLAGDTYPDDSWIPKTTTITAQLQEIVNSNRERPFDYRGIAKSVGSTPASTRVLLGQIEKALEENVDSIRPISSRHRKPN